MAESHRSAGRGEKAVGAAILLVLAGVAAGVYLKQSRFDPSIYGGMAPSGDARQRPGTTGLDLAGFLPPSLAPFGPAESFSPETLSDKIDGKAEQYLPAGFVALTCRRFHLAGDKAAWAEMFVYDMASLRNAFAVFSSQRRAGAEASDLARFAYGSGGGVFFVCGRYYVEVIPASRCEALAAAVNALARNFVDSTPAGGEELGELAMFPTDGLLPGSIELQVVNVFGMEGLNDVFIARYNLGGQEMTGFISARASAADALELAGRYRSFLLANGAADAGPVEAIPGARWLRLFDTYELVFTRGRVLAGVREGPSLARASELAAMLYRKLSESGN